MGERNVKKLRKYVAQNYKIYLAQVLETVYEENVWARIAFAFKVIFKAIKIEKPLSVRNKNVRKNPTMSKK